MNDSIPAIANLYEDNRLWGVERYILTGKPDELMYVPNEIRKCVVFLGYKKPSGEYKLAGTGFFLTRMIGMDRPVFLPARGRGFIYLVTARHVIDGIRSKNADKVCVRVNYHDGQARWLETDINDWLFHPTEPDAVDVAVFRSNLPNELDHLSAPLASSATEEIIQETRIGTGDEVFLMGLFANHHGTHRNIPITRIGNIAAMPEEPVLVKRFGLIDAYLVEARSLGGLSGSPVFVHIPAERARHLATNLEFKASGTVFFLLGLMHGHWDLDAVIADGEISDEDSLQLQRVNMGIAIVVPVTKILEVIEQPMIRDDEEKILEQERMQRLPTADSLEDENELTRESFDDALRRASRKISQPDEGTKGT